MCDKSDQISEPVNLISQRVVERGPHKAAITSHKQNEQQPSKFDQQQQQREQQFEAGRKQLESYLSRNLLGQGPFHGLSHSKLAAMDPLHLQNTILSYFGGNGGMIPDNGLRRPLIAGRRRRGLQTETPLHHSELEPRHPLFSQGICRWTGCEMIFESLEDFLSHLNSEHVISDRSTAQTRVQVQIVSQLELQIRKEKDRLEAMMEHFNKLKEEEEELRRSFARELNREEGPQFLGMRGGKTGGSPPPATASAAVPSLPTLMRMKNLNNNEDNRGALKAEEEEVYSEMPRSSSNDKENNNNEDSPRSISPLSPPNKVKSGSKVPPSHDKNILDPEHEVIRNRDFYRNTDVRPPCTYAALIRQAINESMGRQLTLNEIYTWFQNTFAYFRRNAATWKNAVRHNLSLHKCFMRVENVKGAVWTVDESEYHRRRPQRGVPGGPPTSYRSPSSPPEAMSSDLISYQQQQAALMAEHQAYIQGLGASLGNLRRDESYYPAFPFSFNLKTETPDENEDSGGEDRDQRNDNQQGGAESMESNDSSWN